MSVKSTISRPGLLVLRTFTETDYPEVERIFQAGIDTRHATFETKAPSWKGWNIRFREECRIVATYDDKVVGWAALSGVSSREVYHGVCEVSVYVADDYQGMGRGQSLLSQLILESENCGIWTLQATIFPENKTSIHLHRKHDFRIVGRREKIGKTDEIWRDTILLERRSKLDRGH